VGESAKGSRPSIEADDDPLLVYYRLSKAGYGSVNEIERWDSRRVLQALYYEGFLFDYELAYVELNK
jgi:hypothetical protein